MVIVCQAHAIAQFARVQDQDPRQNLGGHAHVRHAQRIHEHRFHRHAHGERLARAVEDGAARRRDLDLQFLLLPRQPRVVLVMDDLQRNELGQESEGSP